MKQTKMTTKTEKQLRERLVGEQARLAAALRRREFEPVVAVGRVADDDWPVLAHDEYIATHLDDIEIEKLRRVDAALDRMKTGEYGVCLECGSRISSVRLNAIPWAELCIDCQAQASELPRAA
jgi:DnaK suppressor protein